MSALDSPMLYFLLAGLGLAELALAVFLVYGYGT